MNQIDTIVVGAGHNGLVCAAYLAAAGQRVLVLEASDTPGGLTTAREFHPGFRASAAHSVSHFSAAVVRDLELAAHGFDQDSKSLRTVGLHADGEHVVLRDGKLDGSPGDAEAFADWHSLMQRFARALQPFWEKTMPRIGGNGLGDLATFAHLGLNLRRLGKQDMGEFLRIASLPARDLMDERFENERLKAMLSWEGLIGSKMAPRSPNSAVLAMLYRMGAESTGGHRVLRSDKTGLIRALTASARAAGAEIRTGSAVERIRIAGDENGLRATGVELAGGETIAAERIISSADPKTTFLGLVGVEHLDIEFTNRIGRLRSDGYVAKLHLALDGEPEFAGLDNADGRLIAAPTMDAIEFAFDDAKYGDCSEQPVMEIVVPSLSDASLAPAGKHVLSAHVMYVPRHLRDGWTDAARDRIRERAIDTIADYAPEIREQILASEFLTPADLERQYRVTGGHWHHVEFAMDQMLMMRPTYGAAQYRTPIPGLWLCGAGCHPGGDLTGAAGRNAAREVLR